MNRKEFFLKLHIPHEMGGYPRHAVRIVMEFLGYTGLYIPHCHNLEHEDMGMMWNFQVSNKL